MVKIGMTNPPYLQPCLPSLITAMNHPQFFSYLHIPVQVRSTFGSTTGVLDSLLI